jgi:1-pyrroline-5-carboxylate dehydrogenase
MQQISMGPVTDFTVFMGAVIDEKAFKRISGYIKHAKANHKIWHGGHFEKKQGFFIEPTLVETTDPNDKLMTEEIFGPVLTVYVYPDSKIQETLIQIDESTPYALTGSIFAQDEAFLEDATQVLKYSTGNFYINDRSTGSVVGQQPFGGARMSGTNDKAGGPHYVLKWTSPQVIKETYIRTTEWRYSYMERNEGGK